MKNNTDYLDAIKKLFPRKKNQVRNALRVNDIEDINFLGPFVHCSYKRSQLNRVVIRDVDFKFSAWTESRFYSVTFENSNLSGTNFQLCVFDNCKFTKKLLAKNISYNHAYFKNTTFQDVEFKNCVFSDAVFMNCKFENCTFKSSSFNGTKFVNCTFNGLVARNLNLDYSHYRNCLFYNSQISLFQSAYTIGLLQSLQDNFHNNVFAFQGRNLSIDLFYSEYINYLIPYFSESDEYFPVANILCFKGENEKGQELIGIGIRKAILEEKYRLALHYCELINYYNCFSSIEKRKIIQYMNSCLSQVQEKENISEAIRYSLIIENSLLNNYDSRPVYYISIQTDLIETNDRNTTDFIASLDELLMVEQGPYGEHNIKITHNSPLWLDIIIAIGASVVAGYLKDVMDLLILKIKDLAQKKNTNIKDITVKGIENTEANINNSGEDSD